MDETTAEELAEALARFLQRRNRARLYGALTKGLGPGIDEATYPVLSGVARFGPATSVGLAGDVGIDRSVVSRHAGRLVRAGLLVREPDPDDGRATRLALSPTGADAVAVMRGRLARFLGSALEDWTDDDARRVVDGLSRLLGLLAEPSDI